MDQGISPALGAMLAQWGPFFTDIANRVKPLLDQPVIRLPYNMALSTSQVIPPGATVRLTASDFQYSLEYPFEVTKVKFSQDPAHTKRDWRVAIQDQTFNQPWGLSLAGTMVDTYVDDNTGAYKLDMPWVVRPKGGALGVTVTNLDEVNPITVDIAFIGSQLLPR